MGGEAILVQNAFGTGPLFKNVHDLFHFLLRGKILKDVPVSTAFIVGLVTVETKGIRQCFIKSGIVFVVTGHDEQPAVHILMQTGIGLFQWQVATDMHHLYRHFMKVSGFI